MSQATLVGRATHHVHIEDVDSESDVVLVENSRELLVEKLCTLFVPIPAPNIVGATLELEEISSYVSST